MKKPRKHRNGAREAKAGQPAAVRNRVSARGRPIHSREQRRTTSQPRVTLNSVDALLARYYSKEKAAWQQVQENYRKAVRALHKRFDELYYSDWTGREGDHGNATD